MFREYAAAVGEDFWLGGFEDELAGLPGYYHVLLIARLDGELVGSVALKRLADGSAELKRLYVRPAARGTGLGKTLAAAVVERARELGYTKVRLDSLPQMTEALGIYAALGFEPTENYSGNPIPGALFFELQL